MSTFTHVMSGFTIALAIGVLSTGLFSGLLSAVLFLFQKILKGLSGQEFTRVMQRFLPMARKAPINVFLVLVSVIAPVVALVLGNEEAGRPSFWLTLAGLVIFCAGTFWVSRYVAEPLYDVILGWTVQSPPAEWREVRERYFRVNRVRAASSGLAFLLLLVAMTLSEPPQG